MEVGPILLPAAPLLPLELSLFLIIYVSISPASAIAWLQLLCLWLLSMWVRGVSWNGLSERSLFPSSMSSFQQIRIWDWLRDRKRAWILLVYLKEKKKNCRCSKYARMFYHSLKSQTRLSDFSNLGYMRIFFCLIFSRFFWLCPVTCGISVPEPGILNLCSWQWMCRLLGNSLSVLFWWLKLFSKLNCYNNKQLKMKDFSSYNFSSIGLWHFYLLWFLN